MSDPQERYSRPQVARGESSPTPAASRHPMERLAAARGSQTARIASKSLVHATATVTTDISSAHAGHAPDEAPTALPQVSTWQRFVGSGVVPDVEATKRETRARLVTISLVVLACVLMIVSAILLFNPLVRRPAFGLATTHVVQTVSTTATVVAVLPPPTAAVTPPHAPTATATQGHAPGGGQPVATAPPPPPTATTTTVPTKDDAVVTAQSPTDTTVSVNAGFDVTIQMKNTGNTTWDSGTNYSLTCTNTNCFMPQPTNVALGYPVKPGNVYGFAIRMTAPAGRQPQVGSTWQMQHGGQRFGQAANVNVTVQGWDTIYPLGAPTCNNPSGVNWTNTHPQDTNAACNNNNSLQLQEVYPSGSGKAYFAEVDMQRGGGDYDQTHFAAQVDASFIAPYIAGTRACLISQISNAFNQKIICLDGSGGWILQSVTSDGAVHDMPQYSGNVGSGTHTLKMSAQNGQLTISVSATTFTLANPGPTAGEVGVLVENETNDPSSRVDFSNYTMKIWH